MSLGKVIRHLRIEKGMKQKDVWQQLGISQKHLSAIELDKISPRFDVVKRLAVILGVSIKVLAEEKEIRE